MISTALAYIGGLLLGLFFGAVGASFSMTLVRRALAGIRLQFIREDREGK